MAIDEALLEGAGKGLTVPALRLYAWEPACLSLGYAQPVSDVNRQALHERGWELVRRPTGGRAILHTDELTYSVVGPASEPRLAGSVLESYQTLSAALLHALQILAIPAQAAAKPPSAQSDSRNQNPICFEVPSNYEITVEGKKLIGSAQARRKDGVLQHGSLPLWGDLGRIAQVLSFSGEDDRQQAAWRLAGRAVTVETVLGKTITWDTAAAAVADAFQAALNLTLEPSDLSYAELQRADQLINEKYANPTWTERI